MDGFGPLVDAGRLEAHADAVVIADVRRYLDGRSGREAYDRGHIAGAAGVLAPAGMRDRPGVPIQTSRRPPPNRVQMILRR